jgi:hypothetical protein
LATLVSLLTSFVIASPKINCCERWVELEKADLAWADDLEGSVPCPCNAPSPGSESASLAAQFAADGWINELSALREWTYIFRLELYVELVCFSFPCVSLLDCFSLFFFNPADFEFADLSYPYHPSYLT